MSVCIALHSNIWWKMAANPVGVFEQSLHLHPKLARCRQIIFTKLLKFFKHRDGLLNFIRLYELERLVIHLLFVHHILVRVFSTTLATLIDVRCFIFWNIATRTSEKFEGNQVNSLVNYWEWMLIVDIDTWKFAAWMIGSSRLLTVFPYTFKLYKFPVWMIASTWLLIVFPFIFEL